MTVFPLKFLLSISFIILVPVTNATQENKKGGGLRKVSYTELVYFLFY